MNNTNTTHTTISAKYLMEHNEPFRYPIDAAHCMYCHYLWHCEKQCEKNKDKKESEKPTLKDFCHALERASDYLINISIATQLDEKIPERYQEEIELVRKIISQAEQDAEIIKHVDER